MTRRSFLLQLATNQVDDYAAHAVSLSLVKLKMLQKGIEWRLDISEQIGHQGMLMMLMPYQMKLRSTSRTMTAAEARMKSESSIGSHKSSANGLPDVDGGDGEGTALQSVNG